MKNLTTKNPTSSIQEEILTDERLRRRDFLKFAGASAAGLAILGMSSCKDDDDMVDMGGKEYYFGSGDIAILNYAYALEQLEAAFYIQVAASPYSNISDWEKTLFTDIRDHEVAHREFFKAALGKNAIANLEFNFSAVNFSSRDSVLATAKAFEDLGVSAYNGAGWLIKDVNYLLLAGKIVSVEARHAALVRDLIDNGSFANSEVIDSNGLDVAKSPTVVLQTAAPFIKSKISVQDLPTY
ncbi:ferritin-like domain-containing protein [Sphingobacterium spiritivorum]|uniref:Tat pathway signal sequence domain protein n=3 Tax=Sphingobacterium spiritivorum TaxID=258 RepID=D7VQN1_SPHSI|nr:MULTISPECIES: ferritin-like domain-containing protein [Sphingobacterium]EEI93032.1 Tat pathway signal sequence domain protein [Sphingobacterium spiritivorum ATCC 33300]EFK56082.1 Tat pathway signal sequence domain protein [Sphingobacterium spiritivorum ATCC 33861]QQS96183.1 ferritin-like domain-containing protein [Sphingobacterium spiritivorum]QQT26162.1 ferritin-like domain-containing protein [Sphingobacterium spiritivorum]QQT35796.1 ferritin-like domain-containing protein [Sphingobacteriu